MKTGNLKYEAGYLNCEIEKRKEIRNSFTKTLKIYMQAGTYLAPDFFDIFDLYDSYDFYD